MELFSDLISDLIILVATQRSKQCQSTSLVIRARFFFRLLVKQKSVNKLFTHTDSKSLK